MGTGRSLALTKWGTQQPYLTTGIQDPIASYTMSVWLNITSGQNSSGLFLLRNAGSTDWLDIIQLSAPEFRVRDDTFAGVSAGAPVFDGTWYWIAFRLGSGTAKLWTSPDGGAIVSGSVGLSGVSTPTLLKFGDDGFEGHIGAMKIWHSALTDGEVEAERDYVVPQKAGAWAWWGMDSDTLSVCLTDNSGNGHTLSVASNPTVTTGPPIAWTSGGAARNPVPMGFVLE